ncbi:hypothetical protein AN6373.2 [Aspergillus nidulans FGSC A4]|uniref:DUF6590 domain-containing protein n=1 Tax=Emericella nidulans (strain FGSC A4 / ATCC 38163 / CBS 112.46 / NRRL 194 / M139) TaxID=227321 RepID=Q5AZA7_EMENI|nr:hypothetical protein [Aspergillus nidulans FGSC A4]EAA58757.1 hypothetical protein AN6373.2 [Aspergillus nidulans FGSC A4]CBF69602.1 TPA: conserved hypothetical protein [Aspergillus nidulans FGSC A4]|eukprot:XP_663977.1 hypothetical protein AN6373.2 [Aspergillus nidulans FGSC A4]
MSDGYDSDRSAYAEEPHPYARGARQGRPHHAQGYDVQSHYAYYSSSREIPRHVTVPENPTSSRGTSGHEEEPHYIYSSGRSNSHIYDEGHEPGYEAQFIQYDQEPDYEDQFDEREETSRYGNDYRLGTTRRNTNTQVEYPPHTVQLGPYRGSYPEVMPTPGHPMSLPSQSVLDPRYMVQPPHYYREGKVFSILWHENDGRAGGTLVSRGPLYRGRFGEPIYSTIRRMVVFRQYEQCSWCFAITTYHGRGVAKRGVDPDKHAIVHMRGTTPTLGVGEPRMAKEPLEVVPENPSENLDYMSRLNFSKIYTVEHNVKVLPIGRISSRSMTRFLEYARYELAL